MYDARTREMYKTLFKTAEAALQSKIAAELAQVLAAHPAIADTLKKQEK